MSEMNGLEHLNHMHFDILKEIGNIGSGNAISALAQMMGNKIMMQVPVVNLVEFKDIADNIGGAESIVIGIMVQISGDINGFMIFLVPIGAARHLIDVLLNQIGQEESTEDTQFSEMELSVLTEIGNIVIGSYISSLSGLINKVIIPTIPFLAIDMANAILSVPAIEFGKVSDKVLFIESVIRAKEDMANGYFILIPDLPSFDVILESLGVN